MPILHVRNVPQELYEQIQRRAESEQRSISAEVVNLLRAALDEAEQPQARVLERIRRRRFYRPADAGTPDSVVLLREDRERRASRLIRLC
jgi:plasmid stability protein